MNDASLPHDRDRSAARYDDLDLHAGVGPEDLPQSTSIVPSAVHLLLAALLTGIVVVDLAAIDVHIVGLAVHLLFAALLAGIVVVDLAAIDVVVGKDDGGSLGICVTDRGIRIAEHRDCEQEHGDL